MSTKSISIVWLFRSSTSRAIYQTLLYDDDTTSCDCPGWTRRVDNKGNRSCKHTRFVDCGVADEKCEKKQIMPGPMSNSPEKALADWKRLNEDLSAKLKRLEPPSPAARGMTLEDE